MPTVVPITEMRDTAKFTELVESSISPVTVTKNGYGKFVVMRMDDYDALVVQDAKAKLLERIAIAERERLAGAGRDADAVLSDLEERYGL